MGIVVVGAVGLQSAISPDNSLPVPGLEHTHTHLGMSCIPVGARVNTHVGPGLVVHVAEFVTVKLDFWPGNALLSTTPQQVGWTSNKRTMVDSGSSTDPRAAPRIRVQSR
jgi:hypothetical protein